MMEITLSSPGFNPRACTVQILHALFKIGNVTLLKLVCDILISLAMGGIYSVIK